MMNSKQILLIFAVLLCLLYPQGISVGGSVDVNGDGVVNTEDLEFVDTHLGRIGEHLADVNDDNVVNIVDLMLVKNAIGTGTTGPVVDVDGMVLIPAGEFQMGSNNGLHNERPVHTVYVDAFYMDKYEVTNAKYAAFLNAKGKHTEAGRAWFDIDSRYAQIYLVGGAYRVEAGYEDHPVVEVSWYGAMAYSKWAGKRLPTEAEWEKAARGGLLGKVYPWGDTIDATKANYGWTVGDTTPVGSYPANGYGLYDMAGNVWEWCLDEYQEGFYSNSPRRNPIAGGHPIDLLLNNYTNVANRRVLRGGSWFFLNPFVGVAFRGDVSFLTAFVRVNFRVDIPRPFAHNDFGFRCARAVSP